MMTKKRTILAILLGILMALCLSFAVACGGDEAEQGTIRWTINDKDHVTVTVDGKTELPTSYTVGETLTFKAVPANGYEAEVKNGRTTLRVNNNSEYSFPVKKGNNDVSVAVSKKISAVEVTANKALVYYAGETVNNADITVKLIYATGESEVKTDGFIINYPTTAGRFALGDGSFTVKYGTVTSAPVALESAVVGKITLDPQGGKIDESYVNGLRDNDEVANVAVDATTHVLTFTFAKRLDKKIALPEAAVMTRGETAEEQSDFQFAAWINEDVSVEEIPAELDVSTTYTAKWDAHLLELTKIYFELEDKEGEKIPNLIVKGTYRAAKSAYLYLYEGNDEVELVGPTIGGDNVKRDDEFTLTFDMREVVNAGYLGKWMDIKFVAETDGIRDTQEIDLNDYTEIADFCDLKSSIHYNGYSYSFEEHTPDNTNYRFLKAVANYFIDVDVNIAGSVDPETKMPVLTVSGTLHDSEYYGKTMNIDWWIDRRVDGYGLIGNDGTFSIEFKMADWPVEKNCYAHISIVESMENTTRLFPKGLSGDFNLPFRWIKTEMSDNGHYGELDGDSIIVSSEDLEKVFYVGKGTNSGLIAYGRNEKQWISVNADVALKVDSMTEPTKVYYVVKAENGGQTGYTEEELKTVVFGNTDGGVVVYHQDAEKSKFTKDGDKVTAMELWFDVTEHKGKTMLWSNLYFEIAATEEGGTPEYNKILEIKDSDCSTNGLYAVVDGTRYTILCTTAKNPNATGEFNNNTYNSSNLICTKASETDTNPPTADENFQPSYEVDMSTLKLELKNGKPTLTIGGTVLGYTKDDISFDLQTNGQVHSDGGWEYEYPATTVTVVNGKFTVTVDLSEIGLHGNAINDGVTQYLMHLKFGANNFDIEWKSVPPKADANTDHVEYNGLHYMLSVRKSQTWLRDVVQLVISEADKSAEEITEFTFVSAELKVEGDKIYLALGVLSSGYTEDQLKVVKLFDGSKFKPEVDVEKSTVTADGVSTLYFDVSSLTNSDSWYWMHAEIDGQNVNGGNGDLMIANIATISEAQVECGNYKYNLHFEGDGRQLILVIEEK